MARSAQFCFEKRRHHHSRRRELAASSPSTYFNYSALNKTASLLPAAPAASLPPPYTSHSALNATLLPTAPAASPSSAYTSYSARNATLLPTAPAASPPSVYTNYSALNQTTAAVSPAGSSYNNKAQLPTPSPAYTPSDAPTRTSTFPADGSIQSHPAPTQATASTKIAGVTIASVATVVILVAVVAFFLWRRRRTTQQASRESSPSIHPSPYAPMSYTSRQLCQATNNFHNSQLLGKGGFGPVFKGNIDGAVVAVKCVDDGSRQGYKEFKAEVNIISDLRHRNLVKLRGWCYESTKFFLVYDYVPNGSLDRVLFDDERCSKELSWERRFGIVLGLGSAVQYLHEECENVIIHRDIKTSNVLLDDKYVAKLGDFGLSRQMEDTEMFTTVVAGTRGYIAPEVFITGKSNKESDVFSFGAVMAEIACGKRVIDGRGMALVDWVWKRLSEGVLVKAADERLGGHFDEDEMERMLVVALACSNPDPKARPSIRQAMDALRGTSKLPYVPIFKPVASYNSRQTGDVDDATSSSYQATSTSSFTSHSSHPSTGF